MYIPNTFTPDGDELNNVWTPVFTAGYNPYDYHASIYNRWGERIWESYQPNAGWDGSYKGGGYLVPDGVYVYTITFGNIKTAKKKTLQGHVLIVR